jgi:hypothetical protein
MSATGPGWARAPPWHFGIAVASGDPTFGAHHDRMTNLERLAPDCGAGLDDGHGTKK